MLKFFSLQFQHIQFYKNDSNNENCSYINAVSEITFKHVLMTDKKLENQHQYEF